MLLLKHKKFASEHCEDTSGPVLQFKPVPAYGDGSTGNFKNASADGVGER